VTAVSPDGRLVEFVEMDRELHPYFVATQAHPELKSRPTRPHPLFSGLVAAAIAYAQADQLPGVSAGV
jgi:CTP synthase